MVKPSESPVKILLADDSVTMHRAVALALKKLPWQLITCDNGQDALRLTMEQRPDVVIADLDMPGLTGAELCQAIRAKPAFARTKVILLCGSFDQVDEARLDQIPADGRLWKPFESHVLTALIEALLKNQMARETADPTIGVAAPASAPTVTPPPAPPKAPSSMMSAASAIAAEKKAEIAASESTENILRETASKTAPPAPANASSLTDVVRDMTSETFRDLPSAAPARQPSTLKETILPVADVSPQKAMENLWSPDLNFDAGPQDALEAPEAMNTEIINVDRSDEATSELPRDRVGIQASPREAQPDTEFSVYRDVGVGAEPPVFEVELEETYKPQESREEAVAIPSLEIPLEQSWLDEATSHVAANAAAVTAPAAIDEGALRQIVRDEIEKAFQGWLKSELEKTLAMVMSEIDRA